MSRRAGLLTAFGLGLDLLHASDAGANSAERTGATGFGTYWQAFRDRFLLGDGRIVDTGNGGRSHSEGQGWGLLFATEALDQESFDLILDFTERNLRRPSDGLFRWLWLPDTANPTPDDNNATDGDVYIAWALFRAADLWNRPDHRERAVTLVRAVESLLVRRHLGWTFVLPGIDGFEHEAHWTLNPSYGVVPAWRIFARHGDGHLWRSILTTHLAMLERARFGRFGLPPDWLRLDRRRDRLTLSIAPEWPRRFSYDAVRAPLLLAWGGHHTHPSVNAARTFWRSDRVPRPWTDLDTGRVAPYEAAPGIVAIARLLDALSDPSASRSLSIPVSAEDDYYSAALRLLTAMAARHLRLALRD